MIRLAQRVRELRGWRALLLAFLLGLAAATALPPLYLLPLLVVAFCGLLWLLDGAGRAGRALVLGWAFGLGHFLFALHWIGSAFLVDAERFAYLMPLAVLGLAAGLAVFPALATLAAWLAAAPGWGRAVALAVAWTAAEWLRGHLFTGFPWDLIGYVWSFSEAMVQAYALIGVYALGLLTLLAAGAPAALGRRRDTWLTAALFGLLALVYIGGQLRLATATDAVVPGIGLRLVQPNIPQREKWRRDRLAQNFARHLELSTAVSEIDITHVIWPETATPFFVTSDGERRRILSSVVPAGGFLITGSPRRGRRSRGQRTLWNSVHAIDGSGDVVASYDKHHLVPFGEYLPFRRLMAGLGLDKLAAGGVDYSPGPGPRFISLDGLPPFQPLVCYEAIFADEITRPGPSWLLNLTNDAWFGASFGPAQHFQMARARAVEQGLPLVRVANTGISAVVDAHGRIRARLAVATEGVIDSPLPVALPEPPPYARFGDVALLPPIVWLAALLFWRLRRRFRGLP